MPNRPPGICIECGKVAPDGRHCPAHLQDNRDIRAIRERETRRRASGLKSLYDGAGWQRTRRFILARDPLCMIGVMCGGRDQSIDVDHIVRAEMYIAAHGGDHTYFWDPDNLRGACHQDHARKTALENQGKWTEPNMETGQTASG